MRKYFIALSLVFVSVIAISQPSGRPGGGQMPTGRFYGKIVEASTGKPIEYASVQLFQNKMDTVTKKRKETMITGMLTKANGEFTLENVPVMGQSILRISVIGYKETSQTISFDRPAPGDAGGMMSALDKDLGNIKIAIEEKLLDNVTVTASNPGLRLGIDRKIFNVDKNIVSAGGTAVDVMKNVPSVNVDLDGNVTMRNNTPQVFIDGRPTTMSLDQIPADAIESVEIITNPSAKFDASGGTAGILNIVLKKNKKVGYNGSVRTNIDSRGRVGLGGDINLRQEKINLFLNGNFNQRKSISTGTTDRTTFGTPTTVLHQEDESTMQGNFRFIRAGMDYFIDNRNALSLSGNFVRGKMNPNSINNMETDILTTPPGTWLSLRESNSENNFRNTGAMLGYKRNFPKAGHELTADVTYNASRNWSSNLIRTDSLDISSKQVMKTSSQRQNGRGENENFIFQVDYTNPINAKSKFETGARVTVRNVDNRNDFFNIESGLPVYNQLLSVNYNSTDKVYAGYATYSNMIKDFGYQLGMRMESSDYVGNLPDKGQQFNINFPVSFFPSVFLNQKLKGDNELQLNYTRKINRPNFFQLYPYTDLTDSLNISRGNPNLKPEFTNSVELSWQKTFKKNRDNFLASIYYKNTNDLITRFQVKEPHPINGEDIIVNTYINATSSYVTGLEMVLKVKMTKWWDMTTNMNLFTSKIKLDDPAQIEQDQFMSWFGKVNNTFKLAKSLTMQLSGDYQSKTILPPGSGGGGRGGGGFGGGMGGFGQASTSQGFVRANYFVDAGLRFEFMKNRQASLSLNMNDILKTRRQEIFSQSPFSIQNVFRRRDPQVLRLSFNWRFGKFDANLFKRKNNRNQGDGTEGMMGQ